MVTTARSARPLPKADLAGVVEGYIQRRGKYSIKLIEILCRASSKSSRSRSSAHDRANSIATLTGIFVQGSPLLRRIVPGEGGYFSFCSRRQCPAETGENEKIGIRGIYGLNAENALSYVDTMTG